MDLLENLDQRLPGQVQVELAFVDQSKRQLTPGAPALGAETVEAGPDVLAEAHDVGGVMLLQHPQRGLVLVQDL